MKPPVEQETGPRAGHWEKIYARKPSQELSWYAPHLGHSLSLIEAVQFPRHASIIDVGAGDSTLVDDLLGLGYSRITLLDLSSHALERTKTRLGDRSAGLTWIIGDITKIELDSRYDLWHDRAVFHFLINALDRQAYSHLLTRVLSPDGYALIGTFSPSGPEMCSGLPTMRYSPEALGRELGPAFRLIRSVNEVHRTPAGREQHFVYCLFRKNP